MSNQLIVITVISMIMFSVPPIGGQNYDECGTSDGRDFCFGAPANCIISRSCDVFFRVVNRRQVLTTSYILWTQSPRNASRSARVYLYFTTDQHQLIPSKSLASRSHDSNCSSSVQINQLFKTYLT